MADSVTQLAATAVRSYGKNTVTLKPFEHIYTCNTGDLIPAFATALVNPGSTWRITTSILARLNTSRFPTVARGWIEYMWVYVPHIQVWEHWNNLMGENTESAWVSQTTYSVPKINLTEAVANGSVLDHLGIVPGLSGVKLGALTLRAYLWALDQIARDQNIEEPFAPDTGDGDINYTAEGDFKVGGKPYQINRKADYFSTCLPEPQKGPDVYLPLGVSAPIEGKIGITSWAETLKATGHAAVHIVRNSDGATLNPTSTNGVRPIGYRSGGILTTTNFTGNSTEGSTGTNITFDNLYGSTSTNNLLPDNFKPLEANLNEAIAPELQAVRNAFVTKHIYERDARSGTRAPEQLWATWGVEVDPLEMGRPRILDMGRFPIEFEQVEQTSSTQEDSPQGTLTAFGYTNNRSDEQTFSFKYHGTLLCLCAIRFEHKYQYGIAQEYLKFERFDFWDPAMAGLGDQPVYNYELYATPENINNKSIFGYQVRGAEYRNFPSLVTGQVRSNYEQSLDYVHMADKYTSTPTLSPAWMKENPDNVDRTIFVSSSVANQWLVDFVAQFTITDQLPLYSIPGIDRL